MELTALPDSRLDLVDIDGTARGFIMCNRALENILFNRNLVGLPFKRACQAASAQFLRHMEPVVRSFLPDVAELLVLVKGIYYWLHNAYEEVYSENLQMNCVDLSRVSVDSGRVQISVRHLSCDAPVDTLIIGDTIASGATICAAIESYCEERALKRLLVFTICGSGVGARAIARLCQERDIELTIVFGLAVFGLGQNGFDLSFLHPDTVATDDYKERAARMFDGKPVSAVGWDFGSQSQSLRKYRMLCWIEERYWDLDPSSVFEMTEPPNDLALVAKERGAYEDRIPDLGAILP